MLRSDFLRKSLFHFCLLTALLVALFPSASTHIAQAEKSTSTQPKTLVSAPKASTVLYADVQVDTSCAGEPCSTSSLAEANTTRKLAVGADGSIYATYWNSTGIYVAKSTNRGQSFSTPVRVTLVAGQAEIGVSGDGTLYVIYGNTGFFYITESSDGGSSWSDPVTVGTGSGSIHMAVDGDYIYAVNQFGTTLIP